MNYYKQAYVKYGDKFLMEIIEIIQKCIGRKLSNEVCDSKIPICEDGIDSIEMINIIVAIEKEKDVSLDDLLDRLEKLTINMLQQVVMSYT